MSLKPVRSTCANNSSNIDDASLGEEVLFLCDCFTLYLGRYTYRSKI